MELPLASLTESSEPLEITGSVPTEVVDDGVEERVGTRAWAALKAALVSAAENGEDGEAFAWKSPAAGEELQMEGTVTAVDAFFDDDGAVCRRLAITAIAYAREQAIAAKACQRDGGGWNVKPIGDGR